jgi:hypothetical protein
MMVMVDLPPPFVSQIFFIKTRVGIAIATSFAYNVGTQLFIYERKSYELVSRLVQRKCF